MAHRVLVVVPLFAILVVSVSGQGRGRGQGPGPQNAPAVPADPQLVWTVTTDLQTPESAYFDHDSNLVFISNINGQVLEKDGNGYISRLTPEGKVLNAKWVTGLNAPKGMRSVSGTLWVTDIDEVVGIDIFREAITSRVKVDGAQFLNDLATAPDGTIYVSDSQQSRIYMVKDGKSSVFVEGADVVEQPNGLLVDGNRLILGTMGAPGAGGPGGGRGPAPGAGRGGAPQGPPAAGGARGGGRGPAPSGKLLAFDLTTKQRTQVTTQAVGGVDGIERDGNGGYIVTDVFGSRLLHVKPDGSTRTVMTFPAAGADLGYVGWKRYAVVPFLFGNSASAYDLTYALTR